MVLPQWGGEMGGERDREGDWARRRAWDRWHANDYENLKFSERDGAPIVIDDCQSKALQYWDLRQ